MLKALLTTWQMASKQGEEFGALLFCAKSNPYTANHSWAGMYWPLTGGGKFQTDFVVVSPLTSEAIPGINFLQAQLVVIDLGWKKLRLKKSGCNISLDTPTFYSLTLNHSVGSHGWNSGITSSHYCRSPCALWLICRGGVAGRRDCKPTQTPTSVSSLCYCTANITHYTSVYFECIRWSCHHLCSFHHSMQPIKLPAVVGGVNSTAKVIDHKSQRC